MTGFSTRREFCLLLATALATSARGAHALSRHRRARTVRIGILGSAGYETVQGATDARAGLTLGINEAVHTAAMFDLKAEFANVLFSDAPSHRDGRARHGRADGTARRMVESGAIALVSIAGLEDAAAIAAVAAELRIPHVDVLTPGPRAPATSSSGSDAPANDRYTLYVAPADSTKPPDAGAWRHDLVRYGAAQLNDRYRARFGATARMNGPAWAGWFAAKVLVEASLRARNDTAAALRDALFSVRFDGHKGVPLHFAPDGVLEQPLYPRGTP